MRLLAGKLQQGRRALTIASATLIAAFAATASAQAAISETVTPVAWPFTQFNELLGSSTYTPEAVSADNRYVVFVSDASNLVEAPSEDRSDAFVKDLVDGSLELVSRPNGSTTEFSNGYVDDAVISADGTKVAFTSDGTDLAAADTSTDKDVFLRDLTTNTTTVVSLIDGSSTVSADENAYLPSIDADGSRVAFYSNADNLSASDDNNIANIYVRDIPGEDTLVASLTDADANPTTSADESPVALNADGTKVAFSHPGPLTPTAPVVSAQIYLRDLTAASTTWVSAPDVAAGGSPTYSETMLPAISADGNEIAFQSISEGFDPDHLALPNVEHIYLRNVAAGTTRLVSLPTDFDEDAGYEDFGSNAPGISDDGTVVGYSNTYYDGIEDVINRALYSDDIGAPSKMTVPSIPGYVEGTSSGGGAVSPDGSAIVFSASIAYIDPGDTGDNVYYGDVYIRGAGEGMPDPPLSGPSLPEPPKAIVQGPEGSPPPPPPASGAKLAKSRFKAGKGTKLKVTATVAGTLTATYLKGRKKLGSFKAKLKVGANSVKVTGVVKGKKLKPGAYKLGLSFKPSAAPATTLKTLSLKIVK